MRPIWRLSIPEILVCLVLFNVSCGSDSDPIQPAGGGNLDSDRAVTESIGPGGGAVQATDADGATYNLNFPAGALTSSTAITVTPFKAAATGNAMTPLGNGVQLSPSGLEFDVPVSVTVSLPEAPGPDIPILLHRTGNELGEMLLASVNGNDLTAEIRHFSEVTPVGATLQQILDHWDSLMAEFEANGPTSGLVSWLTYTFLSFLFEEIEGIPYEQWESDVNGVIAALIVRAVDNCGAGQCPTGANQLETARLMAIGLLNGTLQEAAESGRPLCDQAPLDVSADFASTITGGVPSELRVGVSSDPYEEPVEDAAVTISVSGGSVASGSGVTDGNGEFTTTVNWDTTNPPPPVIEVPVVVLSPGRYQVTIEDAAAADAGSSSSSLSATVVFGQ